MDKKAFIALFSVVFAAMLGMGIIGPLMPLYAESMGASGFWLGLMYSAFAFSRMIFMPIMGKLSDARGRKVFIAAGLLIYAIISLFYISASNIYQLTSVRLLHGIASCMVIPIAQAYIGDIAPMNQKGTYINLFSMALFLGMGAGPLLGGFLTDTFSMSAAFYTMTGLTSLSLCLLLIFVPTVRTISRQTENKRAAPLSEIVKDNKVIAASIFLSSRAFYRQGITAFLPILAVSFWGMSVTNIGLVLSAFFLVGGIAQGLLGPLTDRINKTSLIIIGGIIAPIPILLIPYASSVGALLAILSTVALFAALGRASLMTLNVELGNQYNGMGSVMGVFNSAMSLGMVLGPLSAGFIMDYLGINQVFYIGAAVGGIAALIATYFLLKK